ncbi:uncharacterized protein [Temnothorax longispinosus]|uniref:uncharacterized protein n=1 Tax=Temnothorax longispinosus TaxID=300112 RepID=UPI003A9A5506
MATNKKYYTDAEKKYFLRILPKYSHIIERKKSDATTLKDKEEAWSQICDSYNISSIITSKRSVQQLKKLWSNLKSTQRDALTHEKQARLLTGGGREPSTAEIDPEIAAIAPNLMTTAPTLFSSNMSDEKIQERRERILNEDCIIPEELLLEDEDKCSLVDDNVYDNAQVIFGDDKSIDIPDTKESSSEIDNTNNEKASNVILKCTTLNRNRKTSTSKNEPEKHFTEDIDNIVPAPKKKVVKLRLENKENIDENTLKIERIKRIIQQKEEIAHLKIQHQETIQKLEINHLKEKYALEIPCSCCCC